MSASVFDRHPAPAARLRRLIADQGGATTLEWALLLGALLYPVYWIISKLLGTLVAYYGLTTTMNSLPFP